MKKLILFSIMSIFLLTLVSAADFTPQGDINLRGVYEIKNATNITANYFFGEGSSITGIAGTNATFNQSLTDTLYSVIKWGYNMTTATYNLYNSVWLSTYNASYDAKVTDNESWNQSHAESLFVEGTEGDLNVNSSDYWDDIGSINATQVENNNGVLNILESWLTTFVNAWLTGKSTDDLSEGTSNLYDNESWNESYSETLYTGIEWDYNQTTATYTLYNNAWISTYNATYDKWAYNMTDGYEANTDTNASTICSGSTTYLDGEGNCDDISSVYEPISAAHFDATTLNITCFNSACTWFTNATDDCMYWSSGGKDCGAA